MNKNISFPPDAMRNLPVEELDARIRAAKSRLGDKLLILGHHYQSDEVIQYADHRGDSFGLAKVAAQTDAEYIVFCGVHFMAETADILTSPNQKVFIPDVTAGCSLADCAEVDQVENAWQAIHALGAFRITPITYVNSGADLKAFCGKNGGLVCTSSNAKAAIEWALERGEKLFFFPDQHLGRNTAFKMGIPLDEMVVWEPEKPLGGNTPEDIRKAKIILWDGYCCVHQEFNAAYVENLRKKDPAINVIIHPECNFELAQTADYMGSTAYIIRVIKESSAGTRWAIATEKNLVNRLKNQHSDKHIEILQSFEPFCETMAKITTVNLCYQLEQLVQGNLINQVVVEEKHCKDALKAVNRMLAL